MEFAFVGGVGLSELLIGVCTYNFKNCRGREENNAAGSYGLPRQVGFISNLISWDEDAGEEVTQ